VGRLIVAPGGANVIPGRADFTIDVRATTSSGLRELERLVEETVARVAAEEGLEADLQPTFSLDPLELDPTLADLLERAADAEGATARRMPSGAGHDAMLVGRRAPAAMIFVPSRGGVSHSPEEYTTPEHVELGVRVLTAALRELLGKEVR
jgi:allantoate deiminase